MRNEIRTTKYRLGYGLHNLRHKRAAAVEAAARLIVERRMIFCLTNGRTATKTLARLLACIPDVDAHHEADPGFHILMKRVQSEPCLASDFWLYSKFPAIASGDKPTYAETSHLFGKGFLEPLLDLGGRPAIILLRRDRRATALSMFQLNDIPGRTRRGKKWYLAPNHAHHIGLVAGAERTLSDYQLCFWHVLEMEARQDHFRDLAEERGLAFVEIRNDDLNDVQQVIDMCYRLGLTVTCTATADLMRIAGVRENTRTLEKREPPSGDLDALESELLALITPVGN